MGVFPHSENILNAGDWFWGRLALLETEELSAINQESAGNAAKNRPFHKR
jgi:hypothetical protein